MENTFELRYLLKSIPLPGQPNIGAYDTILQYRTKKGDWQDVPTVSETDLEYIENNTQ